MKVRYVGKSFGVEGLTDGKTYECLSVEGRFLRIIDDSYEDYLYSATAPGSMDEPEKIGTWEIVEDTQRGDLREAIYRHYVGKRRGVQRAYEDAGRAGVS